MLTIYGIARSRTVRTLWMAEELGLAYTHEKIGIHDGGCRQPEFLAINPNGLIPAISDDNGVLFESLAINLYLAKKHGGPLAPRDLREEALMMQWALWAATELEPHALQYMAHTSMLSPPDRQPALAQEGRERAQKPLARLEAHLNSHEGFMVGGRFTVADLNTVCVVWYMLRADGDALNAYPAVLAWQQAAFGRPACKKAMALREA